MKSKKRLIAIAIGLVACLCAAVALSLHMRARARAETLLKAGLDVTIAQQGADLSMIVTNTTDKPLLLIDNFDPRYWVVRLKITDSRGDECSLHGPADWLVMVKNGEKELVRIPPHDRIVRTVPLAAYELPPGKYKVSAQYAIARDDFFVEPWLKGQITPPPDWLENSVKAYRLVPTLWFGESAAQPIEIDTQTR